MANDTLVQSEEAGAWVGMMAIQAGRDAFLGRREDFRNNAPAYNAIGRANDAIVSSIEVSRRLNVDETRTPAARHEACERAIAKQIAIVTEAGNTMAEECKKSYLQAEELVADKFKGKADDQFLYMRMHQFAEGLSREPDGTMKLREYVAKDADMAKIMFTSKSYLLGFAEPVVDNMKKLAIKTHLPEAQTLYDNAEILAATSTKYSKVVDGMQAHLYSRTVAQRARFTHVDVGA